MCLGTNVAHNTRLYLHSMCCISQDVLCRGEQWKVGHTPGHCRVILPGPGTEPGQLEPVPDFPPQHGTGTAGPVSVWRDLLPGNPSPNPPYTCICTVCYFARISGRRLVPDSEAVGWVEFRGKESWRVVGSNPQSNLFCLLISF